MTGEIPDTGVTGKLRLLAFPEHSGLRLDQFLAAATDLSRRRARTWVSDGRVMVDGRIVRQQSREMHTAQVVELMTVADEPVAATLELPPPEVAVVYEDDALVVVDKPPGVLSQPADTPQPRANEEDLAMSQLLPLHLAWREGRRPPYLTLVHRLDRPASGLLVFARTQKAAGRLSEAFRRDRAERLYTAVVEGHPDFDETVIDRPIARMRGATWRFETTIPKDPDGKPSRTEVTVEERGWHEEGGERRPWARLTCRLRTGRTHQVRVHLAEVGHPVVGDGLYGATWGMVEDGPPRILLHAASLALPHPGGGGVLRVRVGFRLSGNLAPC